jgi:hypothetical protein
VSVHDIVRKLSHTLVAQTTVEPLGAPIEGRDAEEQVPAMGKSLLSKHHQLRAHTPTPRARSNRDGGDVRGSGQPARVKQNEAQSMQNSAADKQFHPRSAAAKRVTPSVLGGVSSRARSKT